MYYSGLSHICLKANIKSKSNSRIQNVLKEVYLNLVIFLTFSTFRLFAISSILKQVKYFDFFYFKVVRTLATPSGYHSRLGCERYRVRSPVRASNEGVGLISMIPTGKFN